MFAGARWLSLSMVSALVVVLASACSGDAPSEPAAAVDDRPTTPAEEPTAPENPSGIGDPAVDLELATSLLLALDDFPPGWIHVPAESPEPSQLPEPFASCLQDEFPGETARVAGGEFSDENTTRLSVNPTVYVFSSAEGASQGGRAIVSQVECLAEAVGDGMEITADFAMGPTYTETVDPAALGVSEAIRIYQTQIFKNMEPEQNDVLVFDILVIVDDNVVYEVDGFQRHTPIDESILARSVARARDKLDSR